MNGLHAADLLRLLEAGHSLGPLDRGLLLLAYARPDAGADELRTLPTAERDRLLVALRRATFGRTVEVTARCPECDTELETPLDLDLLLAQPAPEPGERVHERRGLRFRLPSTDDLRAALASADPRAALVRRTLVSPDPPSSESGAEELASKLAQAWDEVDPLSEIRLDFRCVACEHRFDRIFDVVDALYAEIEAHGRRLLLDIHALASAYGWTEAEVLGLGPVRRRLYVQMVSG